MAHLHFIEDTAGDVVDAIYFCSDYCHKDYCHAQGIEYGGWNGCHEIHENPQWCESCGNALGYYDPIGLWVTPEQQTQEYERSKLYVGLINAILKP